MKPLLRAQTDLFASLSVPSEMTNVDRQEAIALLRTLLMEAVTNRDNVRAMGDAREPGNE
jgi:hypothetical protein